MTKLDKLRNVNNKINQLLISKSNGYITSNLETEQIYQYINGETHCEIHNIKKSQKTDLIDDNDFKRIICIKGKIKVYIPKYDEKIILTPPNTLLITPKTKHTIEPLVDSQLIFIYKTKEQINNKELIENNTIYNKV